MAIQLDSPPSLRRLPTTNRPARASWVPPAVLVVSLVFFFAPWLAAAAYGFSRPGEALSLGPLLEALSNPRVGEAVGNTVFLTVATTAGMLLLLVPSIIWLELWAPRLAPIAEALSVLPLVVPAVALVNGASQLYRAVAPGFLASIWSLVPLYMVTAMPLCYRAIVAGVRSMDLRTLYAAASSLGASPGRILVTIVLPNLRLAMVSASLLCIALCLSEFAMASLLLHYTFPVFLVDVSSLSPKGVAAVSFLVTLLTWALLALLSSMSTRKNSWSTAA